MYDNKGYVKKSLFLSSQLMRIIQTGFLVNRWNLIIGNDQCDQLWSHSAIQSFIEYVTFINCIQYTIRRMHAHKINSLRNIQRQREICCDKIGG